jgi:nitrite reductase/ring-hydroxylating ferredoxin subunit
MTDTKSAADCGGCALMKNHGRREFLREAALAIAALAVVGAKAGAMPVHFMTAISATDEMATYPFPASDGVYIDSKKEVIVSRSAGKVFAFMLACPHQNTALRWNQKEQKFQCPKHHSQYKPDGTFIDGRATRSMDRFAVQHDGANLVVNLDKVFEDDRDHSGWLGAAVSA